MSEPYWSALGGGVVDYEGAFDPVAAYAPGDVVRYNGVDYLAVNPSTGVYPGIATGLDKGGKELAYVERTTVLAVAATTAATAEVFITTGPINCDGQPILIEFSTPVAECTQYVSASLWDGSTDLGVIVSTSAVGGNENAGLFGRRKLTPTPGAHTYSIRAFRGTGSASLYGGVGGPNLYLPATLRVTQADVVANVIPVGVPQLVTALPGSPVDGQECILVDSLTNPTYQWHLRYLAAKPSNKWVFIGGMALAGAIDTAEARSLVAYGDLATVGPSFTVPVVGAYEIEWGYQATAQVAANSTSRMSLSIGGAAALDADSIGAWENTAGTNYPQNPSRVSFRPFVAGATVVAKYRTEADGHAWTFANRWMKLTPRALGG